MVKVGDKVYCKKDYYKTDTKIAFEKGKCYEVSNEYFLRYNRQHIQHIVVDYNCDGGGEILFIDSFNYHFENLRENRLRKLQKILSL